MISSLGRRTLLVLFLAVTSMLLPPSAEGQAVLRPGVAAKGELRSGDLKLDDDTYADLWRFTGSQGQPVRITMRAPAFDAYLQLGYYNEKGDWVSVDSDDDGAGGTDAEIELALPRDAEFTVRANTLKVGETGSYTLLLETDGASGPAPGAPTSGLSKALVSSSPGERLPVVLGQWLSGTLGVGDDTLSDGSYADIWVYQGRRGETLTMVQKSDAVDSYLTFGPVVNGRWSWAQADNNSAGGKDSKLIVTLDSDGEYWVRPNALFSGKGPYTLFVSSSRGDQSVAAAAPVPAPSQPAPSGAPMPAVGSVGPLQQGLAPGAVAPQGVSASASASAAAVAAASSAAGRMAEIQTGQTIRGRLAAGDAVSFDTTYIDTYVYHGKRGERINIIMMSPDFGSYLLFGREPSGGSRFSSLEHTGATAGREAKISVTVPDDGTYWIQANEFDRSEGSYVLTIEAVR